MIDNKERNDYLQRPVVHLILDPSALVRGIGNIKKWASDYSLVLFIPFYTLHELDYIKRGVSLLATNARESIKFIDLKSSMDDDFQFSDDDTTNDKKNKGSYGETTVLIETPDESGPAWHNCIKKYRVRQPLVKDFPNNKTSFDSTRTIKSDGQGPGQGKGHNEINPNAKPEMPVRLRYLIRSCIQKQYVENDNSNGKTTNIDWKVVTEDSVTKVWLNSFGIDCFHINEAENYILSKNGVCVGKTEKLLYVPASSSLVPTKIDSKTDSEGNGGNKKRKNRKPKKTGVDKTQLNNMGVQREKFDTMIYANRGSGELWTP
ncbi:hypothetical protein PACTADRAFT_31881 [Pachysolen tannophilus NRRL Y-2460]|uniref:PIN domain-containing protein n=1 Tax=Pachysolen tannophilus NRRL Y-2460 TaxID=669874 RepID=A0A1E4U3B3_PACTA|nr:hypothetical protein PACTADRAFT_31881 [Pachysolen tannophilus NRRL Y-2460]